MTKRKRKVQHESSEEEAISPSLPKKARLVMGGSGEVADECDSCTEEEVERKKGKLSKFRISKATRKILKEKGIKFLFPIQYLTFDHIYDGKNVIGQARTGTGKTLSYALPILERMSDENELRSARGRPPCTLVMVPTRELANQVCEQFKMLSPCGVQVFCIYGGARYEPQENAMMKGIDILVGTPGRILDHMNRGNLNLACLSHVVLDEADQMLERGFSESVEQILSASYREENDLCPQMMLFSATVPTWIEDTARRYMGDDRILVDLIGKHSVRTAVNVLHKAICCPYQERPTIINDVIRVYSGVHGRTMVFTRTKQDADELAVNSCLSQDAKVLHGDIVQKQREVTLKGFREGRFPLLIATDVAARGLDVPEVDLVIQCEPPKDVDAYIHRSGRTGRAGRTGICIMFYKPRDEYRIPQVEVKAGIQFQRIGAPQPAEIIKSAARDALRSLDQTPQSILPHFKEAARELIKEKGAEDALAAALAHISGSKQIVSRSVLSGMPGFTCYRLCCDHEKRSAAYFWGVLERLFPLKLKAEVKGLRLCKDMKSVVFDLPTSAVPTVPENWKDCYMKLTECSELPQLLERPSAFYQRIKGPVRAWKGGDSGGRGSSYRPSNSGFQRNSHSIVRKLTLQPTNNRRVLN